MSLGTLDPSSLLFSIIGSISYKSLLLEKANDLKSATAKYEIFKRSTIRHIRCKSFRT